ncbi:MAG TPA: hypothetical protein VL981_05835 [Candidatus Methylacidiphilales bacterium]|nr:hypothetical protein [Candidatus Methylacidiphilales bacterium]
MPLSEFLAALDAHRKLHAVFNVSLVTVTGLLAFAPMLKTAVRFAFIKHPGWFLAFMAAALFACRYPAFFYPEHLNPDEAQMVAQAITYESHPVPWRDVDGGTAGPLDSYTLLWCVPFGFQPTYLTSRFFELLLVLGMLIFLYGASRHVAGDLAARLGLLPAFVFLAVTAFGEFIHYSTEEVSVFLAGAAVFLLTGWRRRPGSFFSCAAVGFILGLLPFAKLQSILLGGFLGLTAMGFLWTSPRLTRREALARITVLASAALLPGAIIVGIVAWTGAFDDFWTFYIQMSQAYTVVYPTFGEELAARIAHVKWLLDPREYIAFPIYLTLIPSAVLVLHFLAARPRWPRAARRWLAWTLLFALVSVITVLSSPVAYPHYLFYLFPAFVLLLATDFRLFRVGRPGLETAKMAGPLLLGALLGGLLIASTVVFHHWPHPGLARLLRRLIMLALAGTLGLETIHILLRRPWPVPPPAWRPFIAPGILAVFFVLPALAQAGRENPFRGKVAEFLARPPSAMDAAIGQLRPPGGQLALWGWEPSFAAETQSVLGTREAITGPSLVLPNPLQTYYRERYLHDMRANRPELFLEAMGPDNFIFNDREKYGIASFPELAQLIEGQYRLAREIDGMRLFIRKDLPRGYPKK